VGRNDGKFIEGQVAKALGQLLGNTAVMTRLYDTKSANAWLPPSPGDFMGVFKDRTPVLIEAKSSDEFTKFKECRLKSFVKPTQYAYNKMWLDTGGVSVFVFHSVVTEEVEFWDGSIILRAYKEGWESDDQPEVLTDQSVVSIRKHIVECVRKFRR